MRRRRICGFEGGDTYNFTPSDGNIVVDAASRRSGDYGLHVTAQSGVKSTLQIDAAVASLSVIGFHRFYINWVSLPTVARNIVLFGSNSPSANALELRINPSGTLSFLTNGVLFGTSTAALSPGRWYAITVGIADDAYAALWIDDALQLDWASSGGSINPVLSSTYFGAADTGASAMEYYLDDYVTDIRERPGPGRVIRLNPASVQSDNANFVAVGAPSKWEAVSGIPYDDDTSYLTTGATSSQSIAFNMEQVPEWAVVVRGVQFYVRAKRNGASGGLLQISPSAYNGVYSKFVGSSAMSTGASYVTQHFNSFVDDAPLGPYYEIDDVNNLQFVLRNSSTNPSRVTALWVEVDIDDSSNAQQSSLPALICGFENGEMETRSKGQSAVVGTVARSTVQKHNGTASLKITHAPGGFSNTRWTNTSSSTSWWNDFKRLFVGFWMYVETLPASGKMTLFQTLSGGFFSGLELFVNSDGSLNTAARTSGVGTATAAGTIETGRWYHVSMALQADTGTDNGQIVVYIDDTKMIERLAVNAVTSGLNVTMMIGATTAVDGGGAVYYDELWTDHALRHSRHVKVGTLVPTGAGANTQPSFTAVGTVEKWDAIDELPDTDDADYVLVSAGTTLIESYEMADIDSLAATVYGLSLMAITKADGASSGNAIIGMADRAASRSIPAQVERSGNTAGTTRQPFMIEVWWGNRTGRLLPETVNNMQPFIRQNHSINPSRVQALWVNVLYTRTSPRSASKGGSARVIG